MELEGSEQAALLDEFVLAFLAEQSLESAIRVFYRTLSSHIPFNQMLLSSMDRKRRVVTPWVVMENGEVMEVEGSRQTQFDDNGHMELMSEDGDFRIEMDNDISRNRLMAPYANLFLRGKQSVLAVTVRADEDHGFSISLQSPEPHQYQRRHVDILMVLRTPLRLLVSRLYSHARQGQLAETRRIRNRESAFALLSQCRGLAPVTRQIGVVADTGCTVLILGETGVGKELAADSLHHLSTRCKGPFVRVNCASIPDTLLDSALYGHERGAFTGASETHRGYFEQASGGTLFLDEVGELSPAAQASLLRVLEAHMIQRVGGSQPIPVDVRVVAATNRDLSDMVEAGTFREDLWYRLVVFPIVLPPLRQRREDVVTLARHFHMQKADELGLKHPATLTADALNTLCAYSWPGNARQLSHVMERALLAAEGEGVAELVFPQLSNSAPRLSASRKAPDMEFAMPAEATVVSLDGVMAERIQQILEACGGKIHGPDGAAHRLNINPSTLRSRMKRLGMPFRKRDMLRR